MTDLLRSCREEGVAEVGNLLIEGERMRVSGRDGLLELPVRQLPDKYLHWFERGRLATYEALADGERSPGFFSHHLPVVATSAGASPFAANLGHKGVGPLPRPSHLDRYLAIYREAMATTGDMEPRERMRHRLEAVCALAGDREAIDPRCLGSLEIFKKRTYENLSAHPYASLLFTGVGPKYTSFQLDCCVEIVGPDDPRHEFLVLARSMFEREDFHITQPGFACAYIFWVSEIMDKTPHPVGHGRHR